MVSGNYPKECITHLKSGALVLMPTDTIWGVTWALSATHNLEKVVAYKEPTREDPITIIFSDLEQMRPFIERIHPRVETLLSYHRQPLGIIYPEIGQLSDAYLDYANVLAFRVSHHPPMVQLIRAIGEPLVSISGGMNGAFPVDILETDSGIMDLADHKTLPVLRPEASGVPSVIATYDKKGELVFIRD